jgi:uncharacterized protein with beta-barrel porin domain
MQSSRFGFDSTLLCAAISLALAGPAAAGCSSNAPGPGETVTCTPGAPNPDTVGVQGLAGASGVSVTVEGGASIVTKEIAAITALGSGWSIDNAGAVHGTSLTGVVDGVRLQGGSVINRVGANISGQFRGTGLFNTGGALLLNNAGQISGGRGVVVANSASSTINNLAGGLIFGDRGGAVLFVGSESHVLNNFGTLAGRVLFDAGDDTLLLGAGSVLWADAYGGTGRNTLALQDAGSEDATFTGFQQLDVRPGANWTLSGNYDAQGVLRAEVASGARVQLGGPLTATSIDKIGNGELAITGDASAIAGANELRAGSLLLDGRLGGSLRVASGARLTGVGTAGSVTNEGLLDPGNGIGTFTVAGNYTHAAGATLRVDIAPGSSDRLVVTGQATLNGGTVQVFKVNGQSIGSTRYVILDAAGGVLGRFAQLAQDMPFLTLSLAYDANRVYLDVARSQTRYAQVCDGADACAVAGAVDAASTTVVPGNAIIPVLDALSLLNVAGANAALLTLSGHSHATLTDMVMQASTTMRMPLDAAGAPPQRGIRLRAQNESSDLSGGGRASHDSRGLALDFDTGIGEHAWLGATLSTQHTDGRIGLDRADIDMRGIEGRIGWAGPQLQTSLALGRSEVDLSLERHIEVGTERRVASSDRDASLDWARAEVATRFDVGTSWALQPFVDVLYQRLDAGAVSEALAGVGLAGTVSAHRRTSSALGARASGQWQAQEWTFEPMAQLAWRHVLSDQGGDFSGALVGAPAQTFTIQGIRADSDGWQAQLAITARRGPGFAGTLGYGLQLASDARVHGINAALRWTW